MIKKILNVLYVYASKPNIKINKCNFFEFTKRDRVYVNGGGGLGSTKTKT